VCDTDASRAEALANSLTGDLRVTTSAQEAVTDPRVNAVVI